MAASRPHCVIEVEWTHATYSIHDRDAVKRTGMQKRQERPRAPEWDDEVWKETEVEAEEQQDNQGLHVLTKAGDTPLASLPQQILRQRWGERVCLLSSVRKVLFCYGVGMDVHLVAVQ